MLHRTNNNWYHWNWN